MKILFNGKILSRKVTGIERYARETLKVIDKISEPHEFAIAIPTWVSPDLIPKFQNFEVVYIDGFKKGVLWEQISLMNYARKRNCISVNLDFSTTVLYPGVSTLHDMSFKANKEIFSETFGQILVRNKLNLYAKCAVHSKYNVFTVSEFQKEEIQKYYKIDPERIIVTGNAWQHFRKIHEDESVFDENRIQKGSYYFSLSSNTANKNFNWIYEVAKKNPNSIFVIAGGKTSISADDLNNTDNITYIGYQSDERVKSLYRHCKAFLFPSFYEGFGIPPMEAMSVGAKVIISNTSCLPEIYEGSAIYIDPYNSDIDIESLLDNSVVDDPNKILNKYSWEKTAQIWVDHLRKIMKQ